MIVLVKGRNIDARMAVASRVAESVGWDQVHVADDLGESSAVRVESLRTRMLPFVAANRSAIFSGPPLSRVECQALREAIRGIELVSLLDAAEKQRSIPSVLTLDGEMSANVLAATIQAILRLEAYARSRR
jgi:hypothetical protein